MISASLQTLCQIKGTDFFDKKYVPSLISHMHAALFVFVFLLLFHQKLQCVMFD